MSSNNGKQDPHHVMPLKIYFTVFTVLLVMTAITIYISHLNLGEFSIYPAMIVAVFKACLVAIFFMHLKYDFRFNTLVFVTSILFLAIFIIFTMTDLMTRGDIIPAQGNFVLRKDLALAEGKTVSQILSPKILPTPSPHDEHKPIAETKAEEKDLQLGEAAFKQNCSMCHAPDTKLIGPPLTEISQIYKGNPQGIFDQVRNPQKKRPDFPPMPPVTQTTLSDKDLMAIANFILQTTGTGDSSNASTDTTSSELPK